jgi:CheY-like chemotaxis protein
MAIAVVLAIGFDPWLFEAQRTVWRSAGCFVTAAGSMGDALGEFMGGDFDLVLLDHSIPAEDRDRLTYWIRASGSRTPVACITDSSGNPEDLAYSTIKDEPHALPQRVGELLATQTRKPPVHGGGEPSYGGWMAFA